MIEPCILEMELSNWLEEIRPIAQQGEVATYIPALAMANPNDLGVAIVDLKGREITAGEWQTPFTLQSISKILGLIIVLIEQDFDFVLSKVDMEPTGDPFNSIARLETVKPGIPFNPLINAGAITVCSLINGKNVDERLNKILNLIYNCTGKLPKINHQVLLSEWETGYRNRSLAYFLKDVGMLEADLEETLELYFKQCSIELHCLDLAWIGAIIANNGLHPTKNLQIVPTEYTRIIKSLMFTCGMYNASGKFAVSVGIPSKSGVSGGVLSAFTSSKNTIFADGCGIGVYGPSLDEYGNSIAGIQLLKRISSNWQLHAF
ncbi:MAG: glutaminase A [Desulfitibacter sp. BRH_c19]|nr:MAG: glutaminase A [Desulfitibacter sp. BRH_c19]